MSDSDNSQSPGPIPAGELIRRLISRTADGSLSLRRPKEKAPYPPVVPKYGVVRTGRFERHGPGSSPEKPGRISYFVEILTTGGPDILWGSDLKRAIEESETNPKLTAIIGVQRIGYQLLKVPGYTEPLKRTRWRVERIEYFAEQALQARRAREWMLRGRDSRSPIAPAKQIANDLALAHQFADRYMHNPHDRERFLKDVADRLTRSYATSPPQSTRAKDYEPPTR